MLRYLNVLFFVVTMLSICNADGIDFIESISIDEAKALAVKQNKYIFIETYATWCIPCRKLEKILQDPELAAYFNKHFVNVRINMDISAYAAEYRDKFDVIFLPTMVMLNTNGVLRFKADRVLSKDDIKSIAEKVLNPNIYVHNMTTGMEASPLSNTGIELRGPETIIHVMGKSTMDLPPDLIRQEAYFRLEFMDGSHKEAAKRYLATQENWDTPTTLRFILDFVTDVKSKEWEYLLLNKEKFVAEIGSEQVERTIQIIIYNYLYQGFPRPTLDEAINHYSLIDPKMCTKMGYTYMLNRYHDECDDDKFKALATTYLDKIDPKDHRTMHQLSMVLFHNPTTIKEAYRLIQLAISTHPNDVDYLSLGAEIALDQKDPKKALNFVNKAISLATESHRNDLYLQIIKNNITKSK
jgi:thiol-disulfide isomerase/thioredoxin